MDIATIQAIVAGANNRITWSFSLIAGSIGVVVGTSYQHPPQKWVKPVYLVLFIPGWYFLVNTIRFGDIITRRGIAATFDSAPIEEIQNKMNQDFADQLDNFNRGLVCFGIWLILYLLWWSLKDFFIKNK